MPSRGFDLAAAVGAQPGVPVVHDPLQPQQGDDGVVEVGADEFVGDVVPHAEFDLLAVEQHQPVSGGQGGVGGEGVQQAGFAAAGFACGEQVLVDDADVDGLAEFVDAHVDGVVHGQHRPDRDGARVRVRGRSWRFSFGGGGGTPGRAWPWRGVPPRGWWVPAGPPGEGGGPVAGWPRCWI